MKWLAILVCACVGRALGSVAPALVSRALPVPLATSTVLKTIYPGEQKVVAYSTTQFINSAVPQRYQYYAPQAYYLNSGYNFYTYPFNSVYYPPVSSFGPIAPINPIVPFPYPITPATPGFPAPAPTLPQQPAYQPSTPPQQPSGDSDSAVIDSAEQSSGQGQQYPTPSNEQSQSPQFPSAGTFPSFPQFDEQKQTFPQFPLQSEQSQPSQTPQEPQQPSTQQPGQGSQNPAFPPFPFPQFPQGSDSPSFPPINQFPQIPDFPNFPQFPPNNPQSPQTPSPSPPTTFPGSSPEDKGFNDEDTISVDSA